MAGPYSARFPHAKILGILLLPSLLWTSLLLILTYSPSFDLFLKILLWGIPACLLPKLALHISPNKFLLLNKSPSVKWILLSSAFLLAYSIFLNAGRLEPKPISLFYLISAVVISPVVEEIAFRGVIFQMLAQSMRQAYANAASALLFLLYHIPLWFARGQSISLLGCLWVIFFALCLGFILSKSKSLWTCIIIHTVQNLLFGIL